MKRAVFYFIVLSVCMANAQSHIKIINNNGKPVKCTKVTLLSAGAPNRDVTCPDHLGCCNPDPCDGTAKLLIEPQDKHYYPKVQRSCKGTCKIFPKQVTDNMKEASIKHFNNNEKVKSLVHNKTLVFEYQRNGNEDLALELEKQSYEILAEILLDNKGDSLIKIENNDIFVDPKLQQAIKSYQTNNNLTTQNGEFTEEMAKSFKGNKNLFLKDKVFVEK